MRQYIFVLVFVSLAGSLCVHGQTLRPATVEEKAQMQARGLPVTDVVTADDAKALALGDFEQYVNGLKRQSPCNKNPQNLAYRTKNTGAQVCGSTSKKWGAIGCHPNNNTAIFPTASHGFAAHVDLLRRFCSTQGRCTINRLFGPSASYTAVVGDRAHYAAFVSRMSGVPVDKVFDPNDAGVMGRIATSSACNEGGGFPWTPHEIAQGLTMAFGGARVPAPSNVGQILQDALTGQVSNVGSMYTQSSSSSPFGQMFGSQMSGYGNQGSPTQALSQQPFNAPTSAPQQSLNNTSPVLQQSYGGAFNPQPPTTFSLSVSDNVSPQEEVAVGVSVACTSSNGQTKVQWSCPAAASVSRGLASPRDSTFTTRGALAGIVPVLPTALTTYTVQCIQNQQIIGQESCKLKPATQTGTTTKKQMVLSISATPEAPATLRKGKRATVSWSTIRATACTVSGEGLAAEGDSGEEQTDPLTHTGTYVYTLECENASGDTDTARTRVEVR